MTLCARLVAYEPDGYRLGVLSEPASWSASLPVNDTSALQVAYPLLSANAEWLEQACEVAVEVCTESSKWVEPANGRYLRLERTTDQAKGDVQVPSYQMPGYASLMDGVTVLPQKLNKATGDLYDKDGKRKFLSASVGQILQTVLTEARTLVTGLHPGLTLGFSPTKDSAGKDWSRKVTIYYEPGTSLLTVLSNLAAQGQCDWRMNARKLEVYNPDSQAKRTGIVLPPAQDLSEAPIRASLAGLLHTAILVGDEGNVWRVDNAAAPTPWGTSMKVLTQGGVRDETTARQMISQELDAGARERVEYTVQLPVQDGLIVPGVNVRPGDWVVGRNNTGTKVDLRVYAATLSFDAKGLKLALTLNDRFVDAQVRQAKRVKGIVNGASGDAGTGSNPSPTPAERAVPAKPQGLVCETGSYWDTDRRPYAWVKASWAPVTQDTKGLAINVDHYDLRVLDRTISVDSQLSTGTINALPVGAKGVGVWVRAVSADGVAGGWASATIDTVIPPERLDPPTVPVLSCEFGMVTVTWDGLLQPVGGKPVAPPAHFDHVDVYEATSAGGAFTKVGSILGGVLVLDRQAIVGQTRVYRLVAVDALAQASDPSATASVVVKSKVSEQVDEAMEQVDQAAKEIDQAQKDIQAAHARAEQAAADAAANLKQVTDLAAKQKATDASLDAAKSVLDATADAAEAAQQDADKAQAAADAAQARADLLAGSGDNLIVNGDMVDDTYWNEALTWHGDGGPNGGPRVTTSKGAGRLVAYQGPTIPATGGEWLQFAVWLKADLAGSNLYVELRDSSGKLCVAQSVMVTPYQTNEKQYLLADEPVPASWTRYMVRLQVEEGVVSPVSLATWYFNHANGGTRNAAVSFAGVQLRRLSADALQALQDASAAQAAADAAQKAADAARKQADAALEAARKAQTTADQATLDARDAHNATVKAQADATAAAEAADKAQARADLLAGSGDNLIVNGAIADRTYWNTALSLNVVGDPVDGHALFTKARQGSLVAYSGPNVPVTAGEWLQFSIWLKAGSTKTRFYLEMRDSANTLMPYGCVEVAPQPGRPHGVYLLSNVEIPTVWTRYTVRFQVAEGVKSPAHLTTWYFNHSNGEVTTSSFVFAGVELKRLSADALKAIEDAAQAQQAANQAAKDAAQAQKKADSAYSLAASKPDQKAIDAAAARAEQAAKTAAAADAKAKADAAKAAALKAAAVDAQSKADAAKAAAVAAASKDAAAKANQAYQDALKALQAARGEITAEIKASVNGKNSITRSTSAPGSKRGVVAGDLWWRVDADSRVYAQYNWDGTKWVASLIRNEMIASLDVNKLQVLSDATFSQAVAEKMWVDQLGALSISAARVVVSSPQNLLPDLEAYRDGKPLGDLDPYRSFGINGDTPSVWVKGTHTYVIYQTLSLDADVNYRLSFTARASVANTRFYWQLVHANPDGSIGSVAPINGSDETAHSYPFSNSVIPKATTWTQFSVDFHPSESGVYYLRVYCNHTNGASNDDGYQWFRNLTLTPLVGSVLIEDGAVTASKIYADSALFTKLATSDFAAKIANIIQLNAGKIVSGYLAADRIAANSIEGGKIKTASITATQLAANSVTASELAAGAVTAAKLHADALNFKTAKGLTLTSGTINSGTINSTTINSATIKGGTINGAVFVSYSGERQTLYIGSGVIQVVSSTSPYSLVQINGNQANSDSAQITFRNQVGDTYQSPASVFLTTTNNANYRMNTLVVKGPESIQNSSGRAEVDLGGASGSAWFIGEKWVDNPNCIYYNLDGILHVEARNEIRFSNVSQRYKFLNIPQGTGLVSLGVKSSSDEWLLRYEGSTRSIKAGVEPIRVDPYRLLTVEPKSWLDREEFETWQAGDHENAPRRVTGLIAEELRDAGLDDFNQYMGAKLAAVQYDHLWVLLIPIVRDLKARIDQLETQVKEKQ